MLRKVKTALRITSDDADINFEIADLIKAAKADLTCVGITDDTSKPLIARAVILYCRLNFGQPDDYDRLERAYNSLKGQLKLSVRHQIGGGGNG